MLGLRLLQVDVVVRQEACALVVDSTGRRLGRSSLLGGRTGETSVRSWVFHCHHVSLLLSWDTSLVSVRHSASTDQLLWLLGLLLLPPIPAIDLRSQVPEVEHFSGRSPAVFRFEFGVFQEHMLSLKPTRTTWHQLGLFRSLSGGIQLLKLCQLLQVLRSHVCKVRQGPHWVASWVLGLERGLLPPLACLRFTHPGGHPDLIRQQYRLLDLGASYDGTLSPLVSKMAPLSPSSSKDRVEELLFDRCLIEVSVLHHSTVS